MTSTAPALAKISEYSKRYRWNIVFLLAASQAIAYIDRVNLAVAAPVFIRQYHYNPATVGLLLSMFNWAFTLSLLAAGPFVDWIRARIAFPLGVVIWSLGTVLCGTTVALVPIAAAFVPLAICRIFVGVGEAPMIPSGQRVIFETFPKEQRATVVASFFAGNKVGLAVGIPLASVLLVSLGMPYMFYLTGILGFFWVGWFLLTYRGVGKTAPKSDVTWGKLLKYRTVWGIMLGQSGYLYLYYVFASWLPGYLVLQRKMSISKSGIIGMLPFLVSVIATVIGGWISDRLVRSGVRVTVARKTMACSGMFLATVFTLLGAYTAGLWLAITYLTLAVASYSLATGSVNSMSVDVAPPHIVSSIVSLQNFGGNVGGSLAPVLTGVLLSISGSFTLPLVVTAAVALFSCCCFGLVVGNLDQRLGQKPQAAATS